MLKLAPVYKLRDVSMSNKFTYSSLIQALRDYGTKTSVLRGKPLKNSERVNENNIDDIDLLGLHNKLIAHDKSWFPLRWFKRLFTNIEKQRALLVYSCLTRLSNYSPPNSSENVSHLSRKKVQEIFLTHAPRVSYFSGIRKVAQWFYTALTRNKNRKPFTTRDAKRSEKIVSELSLLYLATEKKAQQIFNNHRIPLEKRLARIEKLKQVLDKKSLALRLPYDLSLWQKDSASAERLTLLWGKLRNITNEGECKLEGFLRNEFSLIPYVPAYTVHYVARGLEPKYLAEDYCPITDEEKIRKMQAQGWTKLLELETLIAIRKFEVGYKFVPRHAHWWRFSEKKWLQDVIHDPEVLQNHQQIKNLHKQVLRQYHPDRWPTQFKDEAALLFKEFEDAFRSYWIIFDRAHQYINGELDELSYLHSGRRELEFLVMIRDYKRQGEQLPKGLKKMADCVRNDLNADDKIDAAKLASDRVRIWGKDQTINRLKEKNAADKKKIEFLLAQKQKSSSSVVKINNEIRSSSDCFSKQPTNNF